MLFSLGSVFCFLIFEARRIIVSSIDVCLSEFFYLLRGEY